MNKRLAIEGGSLSNKLISWPAKDEDAWKGVHICYLNCLSAHVAACIGCLTNTYYSP